MGGNSATTGQRNFQATPAGLPVVDFPDLAGTNKYYLPLKVQPFTSSGVQYYNENDILLIDTVEQGTKYAEFVKITRLVKIQDPTGIWIEVQRQPFGTLSTISTEHPDDVRIYKCTVQYDATWTTAVIDGAGTEDNVYLSQFGGSLLGQDSRGGTKPGDYVIVSRTTSGNDGEIFELKTTLSQVAKKLRVNSDCDPDTTVFEVDSVTGAVTLIGDTYLTGALTINGTCSTPYVNATTNKKLTINNGSGVTTFEVDTCTGDTDFGNQHGTVFMNSEVFGSSPAAYTKGTDAVYVYRHDPESTQSGGPSTTVSSAVGTGDSTIKIASNLTSFKDGDMIAIYSGTSQIEIANITGNPYVVGTDNILPFATTGRGTTSNKVEGTVAQSWTTGASVVKLQKYTSTTLLHDIPATRSLRSTGNTSIKARSPNTSDTRLEIQLTNADFIQPKLDYVQYVRIGEEWFVPDSIDGSLDAAYAVKMPKSIRNPNLVATPLVNLYGGGKITNHSDLEITSGNLRIYGSDGVTPVFFVANDDGHLGDGSVEDPAAGTTGMQLYGPGTIHGNLEIKSKDCQSYGACIGATQFSVDAQQGNTSIGEKFYQKGKISTTEIASESVFHIDNLGASGATNPKDFRIYQNNAIDSFGIEKYWTGNGGRRHTYVSYDPTTGIGQQQANPLQANNNYLINATSGANMVIYLPADAQTGDMIRFTELSGNLTFNTSLIIRALKISNVATAIQGDSSGTKIGAGSNVTNNAIWDSGELIIQTRNASFGLVFAGSVDIEGSSNAQTIPPSLRGWWLMEL